MIRTLAILCLLGALGACSNPYQVTLNDRVVYDPNPRIAGGLLEDPALQACLNQVMAGEGMDDPGDITLLACTGNGVESLHGIENLAALEQLELSDNDIVDLTPLAELRELRVLSLRNNGIRNIAPLLKLPILRFVSLQGNDRIPCRQLEQLAARIGNTMNQPGNCVR